MSTPTPMKGPPDRRMIGLDIGTRRIGVAVSDELGIIASPEATIHILEEQTPSSTTLSAIVAIVRQYGARRVVAGLPRNMKGERGVQAQWTERFVAALRVALRADRVPVSFYDERLTSAAAEKANKPRGVRSPAQRRAEETGRHSVDARAAALILQGYLDRERHREQQRLDAEVDES